MRKLSIELDHVLEIIACAKDYGFEDNVLFDALSDMIKKKLSDEEIESYAKSVEEMEGYNRDDYFEIRQRLVNFRNKFCK